MPYGGTPYHRSHLAMYILLPKEKFGLGAFEKQLNGTKLLQLIAAASPEVTMPRFKMTNEFELGDTLAAVGMPDAFSENNADFSRMTDYEKELHISGVMHKAFVTVNEQGTEAAAATFVGLRGGGPPPSNVKVFTSDHPFLFVIYSEKHAQLYFLGHTADPKEN